MKLIIIIVAIVAIGILYYLMGSNLKELEKIAKDSELNEIASKYPENKKICETILRMLGNNKTSIDEKLESDATLYIAIQNKILIGNTHQSFTRIQTIAHECLHSIQDRKILLFNFFYSNIYFIYWFVICILTIFNKNMNELIYSNILLILSLIYYAVRVFLENDAMIKAKYLAKEFMEELKISSDEEIDKIIKSYEKLNDMGIKTVNYQLMLETLIKVIILAIAFLI